MEIELEKNQSSLKGKNDFFISHIQIFNLFRFIAYYNIYIVKTLDKVTLIFALNDPTNNY